MKGNKSKFCNDCKYYCPIGNTNGVCSGEIPSGSSLYFIHHFYDKSCSSGFKPNLSCCCNVESPEFMELYERNIAIKANLILEINAYKYVQKISEESEEIDKEILKTIIAQKSAPLIPPEHKK